MNEEESQLPLELAGDQKTDEPEEPDGTEETESENEAPDDLGAALDTAAEAEKLVDHDPGPVEEEASGPEEPEEV